jgi:hypothetical protein
MELGLQVKDRFFSRKGRFAMKVRQLEERAIGGAIEVMALAYPEFFVKEMDEIIKRFFRSHEK